MLVLARWLLLCVVAVVLAGCRQDKPSSSDAAGAGESAAPTTSAASQAEVVKLDDVVKSTDEYIIGINYPATIEQYPGLAAVLKSYADAAQSDLTQAIEATRANEGKLRVPYDLSLNFTELHASPELVVIAVDGSSYTGGAHGMPLVARFVWLPSQDSLLETRGLFTGDEAWKTISSYVRQHLKDAYAQRIDAEKLEPQARAELIERSSEMINAGSAPEAANFDLFEPVVGDDGRIVAVRFVFPPYQVGPYSDGTQVVEVPAGVLLPHVAQGYRHLFAGGEPANVAASVPSGD